MNCQYVGSEEPLRWSSQERYAYFIRAAVTNQGIWGLYQDGWALLNDRDGNPVFPVWPVQKYAAQCAVQEWRAYQAVHIPLEHFLDASLPELLAANTLVGVFLMPDARLSAIVVEPERLLLDLQEGWNRYACAKGRFPFCGLESVS